VIVHGHSHIPVAELDGDQYIFNPGSATFPRQGYAASYGMLDDSQLKVMTFDNQVMMQTTIAPR